MAVTLRNQIANRHVAFENATGTADDTVVAVGAGEVIRVLSVFLSAGSAGSGVLCFGAASAGNILLPFNLATNECTSFAFPGGLISPVVGDDLVINTAGSIDGLIHFEIVKKGT